LNKCCIELGMYLSVCAFEVAIEVFYRVFEMLFGCVVEKAVL